MKIKVTGCRDCPMLRTNEYEHLCDAKSGRTTSIDVRTTPDWCPLNTEPLTIEK